MYCFTPQIAALAEAGSRLAWETREWWVPTFLDHDALRSQTPVAGSWAGSGADQTTRNVNNPSHSLTAVLEFMLSRRQSSRIRTLPRMRSFYTGYFTMCGKIFHIFESNMYCFGKSSTNGRFTLNARFSTHSTNNMLDQIILGCRALL